VRRCEWNDGRVYLQWEDVWKYFVDASRMWHVRSADAQQVAWDDHEKDTRGYLQAQVLALQTKMWEIDEDTLFLTNVSDVLSLQERALYTVRGHRVDFSLADTALEDFERHREFGYMGVEPAINYR